MAVSAVTAFFLFCRVGCRENRQEKDKAHESGTSQQGAFKDLLEQPILILLLLFTAILNMCIIGPPAGRLSCNRHELFVRRGGRIYAVIVCDRPGSFDKRCFHRKYETEGQHTVHSSDPLVRTHAWNDMEHFQLQLFQAGDYGFHIHSRTAFGNHKRIISDHNPAAYSCLSCRQSHEHSISMLHRPSAGFVYDNRSTA